jgi:hypothetical protein
MGVPFVKIEGPDFVRRRFFADTLVFSSGHLTEALALALSGHQRAHSMMRRADRPARAQYQCPPPPPPVHSVRFSMIMTVVSNSYTRIT